MSEDALRYQALSEYDAPARQRIEDDAADGAMDIALLLADMTRAAQCRWVADVVAMLDRDGDAADFIEAIKGRNDE